MKVIELRIEGWQAEALSAAAARQGLPINALLLEIVANRAIFEVDSACRLLLGEKIVKGEIEYRLVELFRR